MTRASTRQRRPLSACIAGGVVALLVASFGCAQSWDWARPCATEADLQHDRQECIAESGNDSGVMNLRTSRFLERCLVERGWRKMKRGEVLECDSPAPVPSAGSPAKGAAPVADPRSDFDACFESCRELTDRTKEQCFDVCLGR